MGRTVTAVNHVVFVGVAVLQSITGVIVGAFPEASGDGVPETAYRAVFVFLALCMVIALALYLRSEDVRPSEERECARQAG